MQPFSLWTVSIELFHNTVQCHICSYTKLWFTIMPHGIWCIRLLPISCSYILAPARMWLVHTGAWIHHIIPSSSSMVCVAPLTTSTVVLRSSGPYCSTSMYNHVVKINGVVPDNSPQCTMLVLFASLLALVMSQWFDLQHHYECSRPEVLPPSFTYI